MSRTRLLAVAVAALLIVAGAWFVRRPAGAPEPLSSQRPDIVLITIDTLRSDRIGRGLTPAIDALADRGVRFSNARTVVPLTLPSHVSMMTGLLPMAHGVRENGVVFRPRHGTLAARLKEAGYQTAAFVGAYVLDRRFGLAHGFDRYDDRVRRDPDAADRLEAERKGSEVADAALAWLQSARSPFFLWVHFYDPHAPYQPPAEYLARAKGQAYDGEAAYADAQVARLLAALTSRGTEASTLVVVAGDHGEGLGEHGEQTHGMLAYDSTLRVPLVISGMAGANPAVVGAPVSLVDVAPTLLRRAGLPSPPDVHGVDLLSPVPADRDAYAETQYPRAAGWHALAAMAGERWKLVRSSEAELYDTVSDPTERTDVAAAHPAIVQGMTARLRTLESSGPAVSSAMDAEAAERLRALGYVSGAAAGREDPRAPNPAREIGAWTTFEAALSEVNGGQPGRALPALKWLADRFPASITFQSTYARALMDGGRARAAVVVYRGAIARIPGSASLFHDLAIAARAAGDPAEAVRAERAALALDQESPAAWNGLGLLHADGGRRAEAASAFERAAALDRANPSYWTNLGNARRGLGDLAAADAAYRRALESDDGYADALNGLGVLFVQRGSPAAAVPLLTRALERAPDFHEARLNLGIAYQESGDSAKAAETYRQLLADAPAGATRERQAASQLLKQLR